MKPKLLVTELWNMGDLAMATPFLRAACGRFDVTLIAKPIAADLHQRFWPAVRLEVFTAPWTPFRRKYHVWGWPWRNLLSLRRRLASEHFDFAVSARRDLRDHFVLWCSRAKKRIGFSHLGSGIFLTESLALPASREHRYEYWRRVGQVLGIQLPARNALQIPSASRPKMVLIHTGARLSARVWPLSHYRELTGHLREKGWPVQIVCNPEQEAWWKETGESAVGCPRTISHLLSFIDHAGVFIGNCSGPGHLAAICNVPTFTIFGPSIPQEFAPLHPAAEWVEGKACPYRPCSDYCRFSSPRCLDDLRVHEILGRVDAFVARHLAAKSNLQTV